jgi:septation ring formation regulator EzrA
MQKQPTSDGFRCVPKHLSVRRAAPQIASPAPIQQHNSFTALEQQHTAMSEKESAATKNMTDMFEQLLSGQRRADQHFSNLSTQLSSFGQQLERVQADQHSLRQEVQQISAAQGSK